MDSLSVPLIKKSQSEVSNAAESSGDSDSSLSDGDKDTTPLHNFSITWIKKLFENGFVKHLLDLVLSIHTGRSYILLSYFIDIVVSSTAEG